MRLLNPICGLLLFFSLLTCASFFAIGADSNTGKAPQWLKKDAIFSYANVVETDFSGSNPTGTVTTWCDGCSQ